MSPPPDTPSVPRDAGITTRGLDCGYGGRVVLRGVDLAITPGTVTCILGRSGCGKSTLLRTLLLLELPLAGEIRFEGLPIDARKRPDLDALRLRIGVLFQGAALFNSMTLLENAAFPLVERALVPEATARELALRKLDLVGLARFAHYLPSAVSGGMRKRCGIARALALDPEYLFLDEPSAGLDPVTAAELDRLILDLRELLGTTVLVVTHELASIHAIADHLVMIDQGQVVADGPTSTVTASTNPVVRAFFDRRPRPEATDRNDGLSSRLLPRP